MAGVRASLVAFDVDGTLLRGPSICACIAAGIGREREMAALERDRSIADIAYARATMAAWYRSHGTDALLAHLRAARLAPGAREGIALLRAEGIKVALVSLSWQFALDWLLQELTADYAVGAGFEPDGTVVHFWPDDKAHWLRTTTLALGLTRADVAAVGDSPADLPMLRFAPSAFYVGPSPPADLPAHVRHRPQADIAVLAQEIIGAR
jgi:HAD superfamily phosphoserine phosphatase-like hydrolase